MQYRKDRSDTDISILGYGCMRFTRKNGVIDTDKAEKEIMAAIAGGVNYFDTAYIYPGSEAALGEILERNRCRDKVYIASKLPQYLIKSRDGMEKHFREELSRLKTDHIDYYLMHMLTDTDTWEHLKAMGVEEWIAEKKASGQIRNIGFSYHGSPDMFIRLVDAYPWDFCQIQYNILDEKNQAGKKGLEYAASKGLGVVIMEPLRGGNLTKTVPQVVKDIWEEALIKRSPAEWALRWVWDHPEVTVVLSGMNEGEHIHENLKIAGEAYPNSLTEDELQLIKKVGQKYRELMKIGCTGCRYCMPCPSGVNIPLCFELYNNLYMSSNTGNVKFLYAEHLSGTLSVGETRYASQCTQCGQCLEKCPQHIDIPAMLELVVEKLEGPDLEKRVSMVKDMFKQI